MVGEEFMWIVQHEITWNYFNFRYLRSCCSGTLHWYEKKQIQHCVATLTAGHAKWGGGFGSDDFPCENRWFFRFQSVIFGSVESRRLKHLTAWWLTFPLCSETHLLQSWGRSKFNGLWLTISPSQKLKICMDFLVFLPSTSPLRCWVVDCFGHELGLQRLTSQRWPLGR